MNYKLTFFYVLLIEYMLEVSTKVTLILSLIIEGILLVCFWQQAADDS